MHGSPRLPRALRDFLESTEERGFGVSAISYWEIGKLVEYRKIDLPCSPREWFERAQAFPHIHLLPLSPSICLEASQLPSDFHRDPADQIIVATARWYDAPLATLDAKIRSYPFVKIAA